LRLAWQRTERERCFVGDAAKIDAFKADATALSQLYLVRPSLPDRIFSSLSILRTDSCSPPMSILLAASTLLRSTPLER